MSSQLGALLVYDAGPQTLIGFKGVEVVDDAQLEKFRDGLVQTLQQHKCTTLVVDLTNIKLMSSGVLGYLFTLHRGGIKVCVYNPCADIREVLEITQLGNLFTEVDTPHSR